MLASSPTVGRSLLEKTRTVAEPIFRAHTVCKKSFQSRISTSDLHELFQESYPSCSRIVTDSSEEAEIYDLASAAVVLNWLAAVICGGISVNCSLADAENWFHGSLRKAPLTSILTPSQKSNGREILQPLVLNNHLTEILPYAIEVFETRGEIIAEKGNGRRTKKKRGIYYTPGDLADWLIASVSKLFPRDQLTKRSWLDPACGTGILLRSVQKYVLEQHLVDVGESCFEFTLQRLFGIDTSLVARQSAGYVLMISAFKRDANLSNAPKHYVDRISQNLLVADTLALSRSDIARHFEQKEGRFDFIISNPPYTRSTSNGNHGVALVPRFVRLLSELSNHKEAAGAMIAPLSVTYSSRREFEDLRKLMWTKDRWSLFNFDRTPDSLFGDDVKTRNTVVFFERHSDPDNVWASDLTRWNSRNRDTLFNTLECARIPSIFRGTRIPKCSNTIGIEILKLLYERPRSTVGDIMLRLDAVDAPTKIPLIKNQTTAYNWLPFTIGEKLLRFEEDRDSHWWAVKDPRATFGIFAFLQSGLCYWLWRVWEDGFHLTDRFIRHLPFERCLAADEELQHLGSELWVEMSNNPIRVSNAGRSLTTYSPHLSRVILEQVDSIVLARFGLPNDSQGYIREFIRDTIVAGRKMKTPANSSLIDLLTEENEYAVGHA